MSIATAPARLVGYDTVSDELIDQIKADGYGVLRDALTPDEVAAINAEGVRLCRGERGEVKRADVHGDSDSDDEVLRHYMCIHYPHKVSEIFERALSHPRIVDVLTRVIGPNVKAMQSMLFIKAEGKPGQAWHQDEYFIPTRDRSLTAAWIALDDATVENGCLWVLPGSHRPGVIYPTHKQDQVWRFGCSGEAYDFPYSDDDAVPVEVPAGAVVIFNGYLLHRSLENSGKHGYRRALANHYMSAESLLPWGKVPEGIHPAKWDFRDIVMVAGQDPYAYKGTTDVRRPFVRPDGEEIGCDR